MRRYHLPAQCFNRSLLLLSILIYGQSLIFPVLAQGEKDRLTPAPAIGAALEFLNAQMDHCLERPSDPPLPAGGGSGNSERLRFAQSFAATHCHLGGFENSAHLYDQALVLLAYLASGRPTDLHRAAVLADAMVLAQEKDRTFRDGRLRNAYACGRVIDTHTGTTRLPGRWSEKRQQYEEDEYALGSDTGNMAWAAIALVQAQQILLNASEERYLNAAIRLADWIVKHTTAQDTLGGFYGGFAGGERSAGDPAGQQRLRWRSTEHNIDLMALFKLLEVACGPTSSLGRRWAIQRNRAMTFVNGMWEHRAEGSFLLTGTQPSTMTPNRDFIPLDPQTWSVLAVGSTGRTNPFSKALQWAISNCRASEDASGYDFNCLDGDGIWWEGTAQVAVALDALQQTDLHDTLVKTLLKAQLQSGPHKGALPAASKCGLTTGIYKLWISTQEKLPLLYPNQPHVGATAWYLFALLGRNPYYLVSLQYQG